MKVEEAIEREGAKNLEAQLHMNTAIQEVTATIAGAGIRIRIVMGLGGRVTVAPLLPIEIKATQGDTGSKYLLPQCTI